MTKRTEQQAPFRRAAVIASPASLRLPVLRQGEWYIRDQSIGNECCAPASCGRRWRVPPPIWRWCSGRTGIPSAPQRVLWLVNSVETRQMLCFARWGAKRRLAAYIIQTKAAFAASRSGICRSVHKGFSFWGHPWPGGLLVPAVFTQKFPSPQYFRPCRKPRCDGNFCTFCPQTLRRVPAVGCVPARRAVRRGLRVTLASYLPRLPPASAPETWPPPWRGPDIFSRPRWRGSQWRG